MQNGLGKNQNIDLDLSFLIIFWVFVEYKECMYVIYFKNTYVGCIFKKFCIKIQLTYNIVLVSGVQHSYSTLIFLTKWSPMSSNHTKLLWCYWLYSLCYILCPHNIYFITGGLHLWFPFTFFTLPWPPNFIDRVHSQKLWRSRHRLPAPRLCSVLYLLPDPLLQLCSARPSVRPRSNQAGSPLCIHWTWRYWDRAGHPAPGIVQARCLSGQKE